MGAPLPSRRQDTTTTVVCAVIGALALVGALLVAVTSDTGSQPSAGPPVPGGYSGGGQGAGASASPLRPSLAVPSSTPTPKPSISGGAQLRRKLPLPPGSVEKLATRDVNGDGPQSRVIVYFVRSTLPRVKAFYARELKALGFAWDPLRTVLKGTDRTIRWFESLHGLDYSRPVDAALQLDDTVGNPNYFTKPIPRGIVAITVYIEDIDS